MRQLLLVALGGALGSVLRYLLALLLNGPGAGAGLAPWGTLAANALGCALMGALVARAPGLAPQQGLLLGTGFCGGLTTFSTLQAEAWLLSGGGATPARGLLYVCLSVVVGLVAFALGWQLGRSR